jgi:hypothetical protein
VADLLWLTLALHSADCTLTMSLVLAVGYLLAVSQRLTYIRLTLMQRQVLLQFEN